MLIFTPKAYQKLKYFTLHTQGEISGLGKSELIERDCFLVKDIEILKQKNTHGGTTLDEEAMAKLLNEKIKNGEDTASWNIWWHSHSDLGVFWSTIDDETIDTTTGGPFLISIVVNKKMEMLARIDIFNPFRFTLGLNIVKSKGRPKEGKQYLEQRCKSKIKKCVKFTKPKMIYGFYVNPKFLIPKKFKRQLPLSEEEILDQIQSWE